MKKFMSLMLSTLLIATMMVSLTVSAADAAVISSTTGAKFEIEKFAERGVTKCQGSSGGLVVFESGAKAAPEILIPVSITESGYYIVRFVAGHKTDNASSKLSLSLNVGGKFNIPNANNTITAAKKLSYTALPSQNMNLYELKSVWIDKNDYELAVNVAANAAGKYAYQIDYIEIVPTPVPVISREGSTKIELDEYAGVGIGAIDRGVNEDALASGGKCVWTGHFQNASEAAADIIIPIIIKEPGFYNITSTTSFLSTNKNYSLVRYRIGNQVVMTNEGEDYTPLGYGWVEQNPISIFKEEGVFLKAGSYDFVVDVDWVAALNKSQHISRYGYDWIEFTPGDAPVETEITHIVRFNSNNGALIPSQKILDGEKITKPQDPEKTDCIFDGWYTDSAFTEEYDFSNKVTQDMILYAKWISTVINPDNEDVEPTPDESWKNPFTDVNDANWFYESVKYASENSLMNGISNSAFGPNDDVTRAMFITVLYRIENEPEVNVLSVFDDVEDGSYYEKAVAWGYSNKIINGVSDTAFAPNQNITREQMAAMMYRYAIYKNLDVSVGENTNILSYDDYSSISEYAIPAVAWACGSKVMSGETSTTFNPQNVSTRAQAATVFMRIIENYK